MNIPSYFNPGKLTLNKAFQGTEDGGRIQSLTAADPEGDTVTLTKWTEDTGFAAVMPDTRFTVSYSQANGEAEEPRSFGEDEAYQLYNGLEDASNNVKPGGNINIFATGILVHELRSKAGVGGAI